MKIQNENQELKESQELLRELYEEALEIIDVEGDEYIDEHLDEYQAICFKELVDDIFNYFDILSTVDKEVIDDWNSELDDYLSYF